jgi:hypothetical protein
MANLKNDQIASSAPTAWVEARQAELLASLTTHQQPNFIVSIDHPLVVAPRDCRVVDSPVLAADMGTLRFSSRAAEKEENGQQKMLVPSNVEPNDYGLYDSFEFAMTGVHLGLASSLEEWKNCETGKIAGKRHTVVQEFDVRVGLWTLLPVEGGGVVAKGLPSVVVESELPDFGITLSTESVETLISIQNRLSEIALFRFFVALFLYVGNCSFARSWLFADFLFAHLFHFLFVGLSMQFFFRDFQTPKSHSSTPAISPPTSPTTPTPTSPRPDPSTLIAEVSTAEASDAIAANMVSSVVAHFSISQFTIHLADRDRPLVKLSAADFSAGAKFQKRSGTTIEIQLAQFAMLDQLQQAGSEFERLVALQTAEKDAISLLVSIPPKPAPGLEHTRAPTEISVNASPLAVQWNPLTVLASVQLAQKLAAELTTSEKEEKMFEPSPENEPAATISSENDRQLIQLELNLQGVELTLNKEFASRKLARLALGTTAIGFKQFISGRMQVSGDVKTLEIVDLTVDPRVVHFSKLMDSPALEKDAQPLVKFGFTSFSPLERAREKKETLISFELNPIRIVWVHQIWQECIDYLNSGILGSVLSTAAASARQNLEEQFGAEKFNEIQATIRNPSILLPDTRFSKDSLNVDLGIIQVHNRLFQQQNTGRWFINIGVVINQARAICTTSPRTPILDDFRVKIAVVHPMQKNNDDPDLPDFDIDIKPTGARVVLSPATLRFILTMQRFNLSSPPPPHSQELGTPQQGLVFAYNNPDIEPSLITLNVHLDAVELALLDSDHLSGGELATFRLSNLSLPIKMNRDRTITLQACVSSMLLDDRRKNTSAVHRRLLCPFSEVGRDGKQQEDAKPLLDFSMTIFPEGRREQHVAIREPCGFANFEFMFALMDFFLLAFQDVEAMDVGGDTPKPEDGGKNEQPDASVPDQAPQGTNTLELVIDQAWFILLADVAFCIYFSCYYLFFQPTNAHSQGLATLFDLRLNNSMPILPDETSQTKTSLRVSSLRAFFTQASSPSVSNTESLINTTTVNLTLDSPSIPSSRPAALDIQLDPVHFVLSHARTQTLVGIFNQFSYGLSTRESKTPPTSPQPERESFQPGSAAEGADVRPSLIFTLNCPNLAVFLQEEITKPSQAPMDLLNFGFQHLVAKASLRQESDQQTMSASIKAEMQLRHRDVSRPAKHALEWTDVAEAWPIELKLESGRADQPAATSVSFIASQGLQIEISDNLLASLAPTLDVWTKVPLVDHPEPELKVEDEPGKLERLVNFAQEFEPGSQETSFDQWSLEILLPFLSLIAVEGPEKQPLIEFRAIDWQTTVASRQKGEATAKFSLGAVSVKDLIQQCGKDFEMIVSSEDLFGQHQASSDGVRKLIDVELVVAPHAPTHLSLNFDLLSIQWNPVTIHRLLLWSQTLVAPSASSSPPAPIVPQSPYPLSTPSRRPKKHRSSALTSSVPVITIAISLRALSFCLNRDTFGDRLTLVTLDSSAIELQVSQQATLKASGALGNVRAFDLTPEAHVVSLASESEGTSNQQVVVAAREILGLREVPENQMGSTTANLFRFQLETFGPTPEEDSKLAPDVAVTLNMSSIRFFYHHAFVLSVVDYLSFAVAGVLAASSQSSSPSQHALESKAEDRFQAKSSWIKLKVDIENPLIFIPRHRYGSSQWFCADLGAISIRNAAVCAEPDSSGAVRWLDEIRIESQNLGVSSSHVTQKMIQNARLDLVVRRPLGWATKLDVVARTPSRGIDVALTDFHYALLNLVFAENLSESPSVSMAAELPFVPSSSPENGASNQGQGLYVRAELGTLRLGLFQHTADQQHVSSVSQLTLSDFKVNFDSTPPPARAKQSPSSIALTISRVVIEDTRPVLMGEKRLFRWILAPFSSGSLTADVDEIDTVESKDEKHQVELMVDTAASGKRVVTLNVVDPCLVATKGFVNGMVNFWDSSTGFVTFFV